MVTVMLMLKWHMALVEYFSIVTENFLASLGRNPLLKRVMDGSYYLWHEKSWAAWAWVDLEDHNMRKMMETCVQDGNMGHVHAHFDDELR